MAVSGIEKNIKLLVVYGVNSAVWSKHIAPVSVLFGAFVPIWKPYVSWRIRDRLADVVFAGQLP